MLERLCDAAQESLRVGMLAPSMARQLTRLPVGNQSAVLATAREASLTATELSGVVDLLLASSTTEQATFVLSDPRQALRQSDERYVHHWDPRLSVAGNRVAKRLSLLLDCLAKMQSWLRYQGRGELQACDREPLETGFRRLVQEVAADGRGERGLRQGIETTVSEQLDNEIIHRWQGGQSLRSIARELGVSRWRVSRTIADSIRRRG